MKIRPNDELKEILAGVLPELKPISAAPQGEAARGDRAEYKAINEFGKVFIVRNPASWGERRDPEGRITRVRKLAQPYSATDGAAKSKEDTPIW